MLSGETQDNAAVAMSDTHLVAGVWTTRVTGIISLISSICMVWRAWNRRKGLFHRLVFGMGIHLTIFGAAYTIGAAAVPAHASNAMGAHGTIGTCTAQGFLIYVTFMTACSYYASFSVYSYLGTLNNFQKSAAFWVYVEVSIHVFVHTYPICSGIYLMVGNGFNNSGYGYCFLEVDPIGCGGSIRAQNKLSCERGNRLQLPPQYLSLFWDVYLYLEMIIPTVIMITLYFRVKANQSKILIEASKVATQAVIYLLALYAGIFPSTLVHTLEWFAPLRQHQAVILHLSSEIMFMLFGLMSMLMYLYFSTARSVECNDDDYESDDDEDYGDESEAIRRRNCCDEDDISSSLSRFMPRKHSMTNIIFSDLDGLVDERIEPEQNNGEDPKQQDTAPVAVQTKRASFSVPNDDNGNRRRSASPTNNNNNNSNSGRRSNSRRRSKSKKPPRNSFNIFDGTNASGNFSQFIFDGDSDDERNDNYETRKWNTAQDHI